MPTHLLGCQALIGNRRENDGEQRSHLNERRFFLVTSKIKKMPLRLELKARRNAGIRCFNTRSTTTTFPATTEASAPVLPASCSKSSPSRWWNAPFGACSPRDALAARSSENSSSTPMPTMSKPLKNRLSSTSANKE